MTDQTTTPEPGGSTASNSTRLLSARIVELVKEHDGVRAAARFLRCDPGYLLKLHDGIKTNPGNALLKKMGLRKIVTYERIT